MTTSSREPLLFLLFSGSLQADSLNTRLAQLATAPGRGGTELEKLG